MILSVNSANLGMVKRMIRGLSQSNAAARFPMIFLSALCVLCGKNGLWRILSQYGAVNVAYIVHSPIICSIARRAKTGYNS